MKNKNSAQHAIRRHFNSIETPRPVRAEWERSLAALKPWLSPEKFRETEKIHWRMFERANRWFEADVK